MNRKIIAASLIAAGLGGAVFAEPAVTHSHFWRTATAQQPSVAVAKDFQSNERSALPSFSSIVKRNGPAVVNVSVVRAATERDARANAPRLDPNDPMYEFFKRFQAPRGEHSMRGMGSGFIVSADGTILTNAHVVDGAAQVTVKLTDRREFKAKVIGADKRSDVAVLKIDATDLPTVQLGRSADLGVGDWVLAIGAPFGFENSATSGIVSAKSRHLPDDSVVPFIQTDVAVNPGNSGGPLFNMAGEVIGINAQIYSRTGGYQGLSFAIPIELASKVKDQLVQHGKVVRGKLGVTIQPVNQALAESFGLNSPTGALVSDVEKGSAADKAGLTPGDVIVAINGTPIDSSEELPALVTDFAPGTTVKLELMRKGATKSIEAKIGQFDSEALAANTREAASQAKLGVAVRPLSSAERAQLEVPGGLVVENVSGVAERAGVKPGDIILSLNGTGIDSTEQLRSLAADAKKSVAILIQRDGARIFIPLDLS